MKGRTYNNHAWNIQRPKWVCDKHFVDSDDRRPELVGLPDKVRAEVLKSARIDISRYVIEEVTETVGIRTTSAYFLTPADRPAAAPGGPLTLGAVTVWGHSIGPFNDLDTARAVLLSGWTFDADGNRRGVGYYHSACICRQCVDDRSRRYASPHKT